MADLIYNIMAFSESNSEDDQEVFMLGQGDVTANQTKEEITQAAATKITRLERLARNAWKATGEKANISTGPNWRLHQL
jgi:predicted Zn-dependent peptidase